VCRALPQPSLPLKRNKAFCVYLKLRVIGNNAKVSSVVVKLFYYQSMAPAAVTTADS
jgi:hypothetical protein